MAASSSSGQGRATTPFVSELKLVAYATGNLGKNLVLSACDITLLFLLTVRLGVAATMAAELMTVAFVGDLVFGLASGAFVSWAQARGASYRFLLVVGSVPCGVAFALLYAVPWLGLVQFLPLVLIILAFRATYSFIDIPHNAMLANITADGRARVRTSGYRNFFSAAAALFLANSFTPAVVSASSPDLPRILAGLGVVGGLCIVCVMWIASRSDTPLPTKRPAAPDRRPVVFAAIDRLTLAMIALAFITGFAMKMFSGSLLYVSTYILHRPQFASMGATTITIGEACGVLLWMLLVRRYDKISLLMAGHLLTALAIVAFALSGPNLQLDLACAFAIGLGFASVFMLPWAIFADAVDFAEFRYGVRQEASTFATFLVAIKIGGATTTCFISFALAALHFRPGTIQAPALMLGLELLAFGVPVLGSISIIAILSQVRMNHRRHALVAALLQKRRSAAYGVVTTRSSVASLRAKSPKASTG